MEPEEIRATIEHLDRKLKALIRQQLLELPEEEKRIRGLVPNADGNDTSSEMAEQRLQDQVEIRYAELMTKNSLNHNNQ